MKKTLSIVLVFACILVLAMPVIAAEITTDVPGSNSSETVINYGVSRSFLIVIPTEFRINPETKTAAAEIKASNVLIPYGKTLNIKISGHDYDGSWELVNTSDPNSSLTYIIGTSEGASDIVNNTIVLSAEAGTNWNSEIVEMVYLKVIDTATVSGRYSDTLTFTVSVD